MALLHRLKEKIKSSRILYAFAYKFIMWKESRPKIIKGRNNKITKHIASYKTTYYIIGDNNVIEVGKGSKLSNLEIVIKGNNNRLVIGECADILGGRFWLVGNNCLLDIGNNVSVYKTHYAVTEDNQKITVGDYSQTGERTEIRTGDSHSIIDSATNQRINYPKSIEIGKRVWIGVGVAVLKGVKIGDNAIVGTSAVVTKDVEPNTIVAGNPAKAVKSNIVWDHRLVDSLDN